MKSQHLPNNYFNLMKNLRAIFTGAERSILPGGRIVYFFKIQCNFFWLFAVFVWVIERETSIRDKH